MPPAFGDVKSSVVPRTYRALGMPWRESHCPSRSARDRRLEARSLLPLRTHATKDDDGFRKERLRIVATGHSDADLVELGIALVQNLDARVHVPTNRNRAHVGQHDAGR